ncbi:MAG: sugar ABC transporter ATP-binding protein [bacterium]
MRKWYGPVRALHQARLEIHRGEVVALAGENGSGKSTLARVISAVVSPDAGTLELDGTPVRFASPRSALDAGICLVTQEPTLVPSLSVAENVLLPRLGRVTSIVRRERLAAEAAPYLGRLGLEMDPRRPAGSLSGGEQELVEVAKALATDPRLLILDEVTSRLPDPERLFSVVEQLTADGLAVVLITHRLQEIRRLADRAVVLRDGSNAAELRGAELSDEQITAAMVGRDLGEFFHKPDRVPGDVVLEIDSLAFPASAESVTLRLRAGEIVGVAGLVGSGRSRLLETVAGLRRPVGGRIRVRQAWLRPGHPGHARTNGVVLVPEDRLTQALIPGASIAANLAMPWLRIFNRHDRVADLERAEHAVASYGIKCAGVGAPVLSLSGGNAQKLAVAGAIASEPAVLLLDEPTRGVDVGARSDIYAIIADLVQRDAAVLLASSDLQELLGLCDRIVVLSEGRVAGILDRAEATEESIALLAHAGSGRESGAGTWATTAQPGGAAVLTTGHGAHDAPDRPLGGRGDGVRPHPDT